MTDWSAGIEDNGWPVATVKAGGIFRAPDGKPIARLDLRYEFCDGERFVRLLHTLTWMVQDPAFGAREWALRLQPNLGAGKVVRIGESDYTDAHAEVPWTGSGDIAAFQDSAEHFSIAADGRPPKEGRRLGGWVAADDESGRGLGIALRDAWQTFPTALGVEDGALRVAFWPQEAGRMAFRPEDIMPPDFFNDAKYWNKFDWVSDKGRFVHEYAHHPHFLHTAEGAARTHEVWLNFYDEGASRTMGEINSVSQHPVILRQHPASAMRVPFMGFDLEPVRADYPTIERSIENLGRMAVGRWPETHHYGIWRYGMVRWAGTGVSYRWMDGHQYDLLLVPWMLFMRGGGRHWYEEAEATARFAMDVGTNHFNTRGLPTGYQSTAAGMPFPWHSTFLTKGPKIHFLAYYHHLAGYRRAREVLDEVVAGNKQRAGKAFSQPDHRRGDGRELYNMNVFWVNAWEETHDPEIKELAREWLQVAMTRQYDAGLKVFKDPNIYLFPGLVLQHRLWNDGALKSLMLRDLGGTGYPGLEDGGVYRAEDAPGCGWAYGTTGDRRYVKVAWDVARTLADLVPDHDWSSPRAPEYPILGNQIYRQFLLPTIAGYSDAARLGMNHADPFDLRDTFIGLASLDRDRARGELRLRARRNGALRIRFIFSGQAGAETGDMSVAAFGADGSPLAEATVPAAERTKVEGQFRPKD